MSAHDHKDEYAAYLEEKHAKFNTTPELIDQLVEKATGWVPQSRRKLMLGEVNEVYEVMGRNSGDVIVRISRHEGLGFEAERWAIGQCLAVGVPAPNVLLVDSVVDGGAKLNICIEDKLPGEPLSRLLGELSTSEIRSLVNRSGEILNKIHSVATSRFGRIDEHGVGAEPTWVKVMLRAEDELDSIYEAASKTDFPRILIDNAIGILRQHAQLYENADSRLLHTDYGPKHILINKGKISGILDFEGAKSGDPAWDFAWWDFFQSPKLPLEWLAEGYRDKKLLGDDLDLRIKLVKLNLGLSLLDYYYRENNQSGVTHTKDKLMRDIEGQI